MTTPEFLSAAAASIRIGRYLEALDYLNQAGDLDPDHPGILNLRASLLLLLGRTEEALPDLSKALSLNDEDADALSNFGLALIRLSRQSEALQYLERALRINPRHVGALNNYGLALCACGRFDEGLKAQELALLVAPQYEEAHFGRAVALIGLHRTLDAIECLAKLLSIAPNHQGALSSLRGLIAKGSLGKPSSVRQRDVLIVCINAFNHARRHADALHCCSLLLEESPDDVGVLNSQGLAHGGLNQYAPAIACFERALALSPADPILLNNLAYALGHHFRYQEAVGCLNKALSISPAYWQARYNRGFAHLALGNLPEGFADQEARWCSPQFGDRMRSIPGALWSGKESLKGKTILLWNEQGLGDAIQFVRYAALLRAADARVLVRAPESLHASFASVSGVDRVLLDTEPFPEFDFHCPLISLPFALGTTIETIPASVPYIQPDPDKVAEWSRLLGGKTKPRVGLVWAGQYRPPLSLVRDIPFSGLNALRGCDVEFVSLQKEVSQDDLRSMADWPSLRCFHDQLTDFSETAALIANVDLVITVDTAVAHLAGAMGKAVWIMNRYSPCWRWLRDRSDSPWYPSVTLFKQGAPGDWGPVVDEVRSALQKLSDEFHSDPGVV